MENLFFTKKLMLKNRNELSKLNESKIIKFHQILEDKKHHIWIYQSRNLNNIISFLDYDSGKENISAIVKELQSKAKQVSTNNSQYIKKHILKVFNNFNWISIQNLENLKFQINLKEKTHRIDFQLLMETLKKLGINSF